MVTCVRDAPEGLRYGKTGSDHRGLIHIIAEGPEARHLRPVTQPKKHAGELLWCKRFTNAPLDPDPKQPLCPACWREFQRTLPEEERQHQPLITKEKDTEMPESKVTPFTRTVGARIRQRREDLRLMSKTVSERVGVSGGHYSNIEQGGNTTLDMLDQIAKALDTEVIYLVSDISFGTRIVTAPLSLQELAEQLLEHATAAPPEPDPVDPRVERLTARDDLDDLLSLADHPLRRKAFALARALEEA